MLQSDVTAMLVGCYEGHIVAVAHMSRYSSTVPLKCFLGLPLVPISVVILIVRFSSACVASMTRPAISMSSWSQPCSCHTQSK